MKKTAYIALAAVLAGGFVWYLTNGEVGVPQGGDASVPLTEEERIAELDRLSSSSVPVEEEEEERVEALEKLSASSTPVDASIEERLRALDALERSSR
ncbi:MAG: hypothetical protein HZA81_04500 [Candidatus Taylorbacteria bacterium]|nr:hypothetical protein [Candidatus Taylorbacteria bacterium]